MIKSGLYLTIISLCANLFYRSKEYMMIDKSNDEESSLAEVLQRIPGGMRTAVYVSELRGIDGKQMNMASEQRTELLGAGSFRN